MTLTTNLYRSGNTTSPRFDNVREGKDIQVDSNGDVHPSEYALSIRWSGSDAIPHRRYRGYLYVLCQGSLVARQ